jgi:tetratricopeptide (TPR) repeat protein
MKGYQGLIQQCDADIQAGRNGEVRKRLASINTARVPREWRLPLAKICRRAGLFSAGLKLLNKAVMADGKNGGAPATPAETAEYAVLLQRSGALREAFTLLSGVDSVLVPEALLYKSFVHFARWEFDQAVPQLKAYLGSDLENHARAVGEVNLAFALSECRRHDEALGLLEAIARTARGQMLSNCHALQGQVHLQQGDYKTARREFRKAQSLISTTPTNDQFFAIKGTLILEGLENADLSAFERLRELAVRHRMWEARREADLYSLKVAFDRERFLHLYCGSPYAGFREKLCAEFGIRPAETAYILGSKAVPRMDLRTGSIDGKEMQTSGRKCHQLLDVLLYDFYRPIRVGGIFSELFPNEHFNPATSPHRVHQLILRTRQWLNRLRIPAVIREKANFYSLELVGLFAFEVPLSRTGVDITQLHFEKLRFAFGSGQFSAQDAAKRLRLSRASVYRLIQKCVEERKIERLKTFDRASLFKITA